MDKYIYDEKNGLWYELQGDYYLPCLKLPEEVEVHIGVWGQHHRRYLKEHRKIAYTRLLTSGKLNRYLADIDQHTDGKSVIRLLSKSAPRPDAVPTAPNMEDLYLYYFGR